MTGDWKERLKRIQEANKKTDLHNPRGERISMSRKNKCAMCGRGWRSADKDKASILDNQLRYCRQCARRTGKI